MSHPYQCLLYCSQPGDVDADILVAASGPYLHTFSVEGGAFLSTWPLKNTHESSKKDGLVAKEAHEAFVALLLDQGSAERPQKRRRLSPSRDNSGSSAEIVVDDGKDVVLDVQAKQNLNPSFIKLAGTTTGQYVVAATGEDNLMPKRPCALVLTPDNSTILCADKFGDVYSLPLLGQTHETAAAYHDEKAAFANRSNPPPLNRFVPAATSLTVHTKGNREALRQQQKITNAKAEKKALNFDHQLLLGHVSLLTDVICASITRSPDKRQDYILTSDRDEHIRVSRGIPQAHIVEGYCLGHTEFISKLCIVPAYPHLLISGGGDGYLILWNWLAGKIQQKIHLRTIVEDFKKSYKYKASSQILDAQTTQDEGADKIAISNIVSHTIDASNENEPHTEIIVTCEGLPVLFIFSLSPGPSIIYETSIPLEGNVLDVVCSRRRGTCIIYAMDTIHKPFSTSVTADDQDQNVHSATGALRYNLGGAPNEAVTKSNGKLIAAMARAIEKEPSVLPEPTAQGRSIKELLYGLEGLRKRGTEEQEDIDN